jgi:hypothetical protein
MLIIQLDFVYIGVLIILALMVLGEIIKTNTCVYRCPPGSFGDWQTDNRYCVEVCTAGTFADELTQTCVS